MKKLKLLFLSTLLCCIIASIYSCNSSSNNSVQPPTTITVNGKVLDTYGNPVSPVTVVIGTQNTTTAGDGSFTINNVSTPYDAYVLSPTLGVFGVKGLSLTNPFLPCGPQGIKVPGFSVTIPLVPSGSKIAVIFQDTVTGKVSGDTVFTTGMTGGVVNMGGITGQMVAGKLYVLEYNESSGVVSSYTGYAEQSASFTIGMNQVFTFTSLNVMPGQSTVSGTVNSSGGSNLVAQLYINFGSKNNFPHRGRFIESTTSSAFNFNVPTGTTTQAQLNVVAFTNSPSNAFRMKTLTVGSSGNVINLDTVPALLTPPNNATSVDTSTMFTYSSGSGNGLHFVRLTPTGATGKYFQIVTKGTSITIPNLSAYGYTLGQTAGYTWYDNKTLDLNSTDDYCSQLADLNPSILGNGQSTQFMFTSK